jgi:hypothetical protein
VALARVTRRWRPEVIAKHAVHFPASTPPDWHVCIEALQQAVHELSWQKADASVVISNHFVRYALVPWSEHLVRDDEKEAWVRHHFTELYGEPIVPAEYRWSEERPDGACIASAVDRELIARIRTVFDSTSIRLRSVQPYLMAAFNRCRRYLRGVSAWIVVPESGRVCIAAFANGAWQTVTTQTIGSDWQADLSIILERELLLAPDQAPALVLAYGPDVPSLDVPSAGDTALNALVPRALPGYSPQADADYAMALTEIA